jgi:hypothetical protein
MSSAAGAFAFQNKGPKHGDEPPWPKRDLFPTAAVYDVRESTEEIGK